MFSAERLNAAPALLVMECPRMPFSTPRQPVRMQCMLTSPATIADVRCLRQLILPSPMQLDMPGLHGCVGGRFAGVGRAQCMATSAAIAADFGSCSSSSCMI